jgi:hypothetical protein
MPGLCQRTIFSQHSPNKFVSQIYYTRRCRSTLDVSRHGGIDVHLYINPAGKYSTVVIPACLPLRRKGAGIQKDTGCRIKHVLDLIGDPA